MAFDGEKLASGHVVTLLKGEEAEKIKKNFFFLKDGVMRANPGNWILSTHFSKFSKLIYDFEIRPSDTVVTSFPKSGTTWAQEIVWNLVHNPDLKNPDAYLSIDARFPFIESDVWFAITGADPPNPEGDPMKLFAQLCPGKHWRDGILVFLAAFFPSPRMLKTHLPLCILPPKMIDTCKVCYVARDPRDVIISLHHYMRLHKLWGFCGTFDDCIDHFLQDEIYSTPYWTHLKLAWDQRNHPNMCFLYYEDMKDDIEGQIRRVDKFLGTNRTDEQIQNIIKHTRFSEMRERSAKNPPSSNDGVYYNKEVSDKEGGFFRKGEAGDWVNRLTPEQKEKVNAWMAKHIDQFGEDFKYKV